MVDIEQFIFEVKRRPVLWDPNHVDYNQRHSKLAAWEEVSANLYYDWCDLSNYDKFGKVRDIQSRWKNIRDSYIRELKYERKVEKGLAIAKKNKYKYSHLLEFLNATSKGKGKGSDHSSTDESPDKKEDSRAVNHGVGSAAMVDNKANQEKVNGNRRAKRFKSNNLSFQLNLQSDSSTMDSDCNNKNNGGIKHAKPNEISTETTQPQVHSSIEMARSGTDSHNQTFQDFYNRELVSKVNTDYLSPTVEIHPGYSSLPLDQDDDKMFLLSLLPYFKKLNEEEKLEARIEMSKLLKKTIYKK